MNWKVKPVVKRKVNKRKVEPVAHLEQLVAQELVAFTVVELVVNEAVEKAWSKTQVDERPRFGAQEMDQCVLPGKSELLSNLVRCISGLKLRLADVYKL